MTKRAKLEIMGNEILKDPMEEPKNSVLKNLMGKKYKFYSAFVEMLIELELNPEWNYYNDTKCWLCRLLYKKKTYCWLSILDTGIKITIYFSEETVNGIYEMGINENIKKMTKENEIGRKNPPVIVLIKNEEALNDSIKILKYRKSLGK
jgi:hypothetical protein